jgi:SAM-dependent methyltransferase
MSSEVEDRRVEISTLIEHAVRAPSSRAPEPIELLHTKPLHDPSLRQEAEIANQAYAAHANDLRVDAAMFRKYAEPSELWDWRQLGSLLLGDLAGKELLDYGCGKGDEALYLAKLGARVSAIDISDVGVAHLRKRAEAHKLDVRAFEMRCDQTSFPADSFDRIHGKRILRHVGVESALAEVWRILRPGGIAVFLEPIGDAPAIEAVKAFLMKHARFLGNFDQTANREHTLTWSEIDRATRRFSRANLFPYHLLSRLKRLMPASMHDPARRLDHGLMSLAPSLRHYAGEVVIQLVK